jgi:DNA invertase Pin-like site-specific DNA recombinase
MANGLYVGYYRVSTKAQGASGLGLEAQQTAVRSYLNGGDWDLVGEFTDVESGTRKGNNRPELAKALAVCKRLKATLVIAKLDRLARNVAFVSRLMESGVDFVAVDIPHANKLTIHILAAVAEAEAEATSIRTKAALAAAKARGVVLGKPDNMTHQAQCAGAAVRRDQAVESYVKLVGIIASLRGKGFSFAKIATHLNDLGEVTSGGAPFQAMTVKRILDRTASAKVA